MKLKKTAALVCVALALFISSVSALRAATITFQSSDAPDVVAGEDLRNGSLTVSGVFEAGGGFTVYFPHSVFEFSTSDLSLVPDWDVQVFGPNIADNLLYDALSFNATTTTAAPFAFDFLFLGTGTPSGVFPFEVYDSSFATIESGTTIDGNGTVNIPDAGGAFPLIGLSAVGLWLFRRWRI